MTAIPLLVPGAPTLGLAVKLDTIAFNQGAVDNLGVEFYLSDLEGWDSPALREDLDPRPLAHGSFRGSSFYGQRDLGLKGTLLSPNGLEALRAAKDRLAYVCDLTDTDGLLTVGETPAKQVLVRRSGRLRYAQVGGHLLRWELDLTAADPRKYAAALRSVTLGNGQTASAGNAGTFRGGAPLRIVFGGAGTLTVGSQVITATGPVTVDTADGTALSPSGTTAFSSVTGAFPTLPALSSTALAYSGANTVTVTWRDAWV